jgi:hypothetical protein
VWQTLQTWRARQDTLVAAVGTQAHLMGEHELQKCDQDSGRREAALLAEPVWVPRTVTATVTPRQREQREQSASHRSAGPSLVVALGVGAKGSLVTTPVMTPGGRERFAPLLIRIATPVMTPGGHGRFAAMRATLVVTRGPVLRLPRQSVAGHGLERLCVAQR